MSFMRGLNSGSSKVVFLYLIVFFIVGSCNTKRRQFEFVKGSESGVTFANNLNPSESLNILTYLYYYNGAGVAVADFNNDGLNDIYFASNQEQDKLYINRGNFSFEDVTERSGISNLGGWTSGVSHVDLNADGLLDIYICKVGNHKAIAGNNLLFINQGNDNDGIPTFVEKSHDYSLDISAYSTQAAFFDYDLDGDLDMYLLCHAINPNSNYGRGINREGYDSLAGDRFFENIDGKFEDVSQQAGIFQGKIGYGLGLAIGDLNNDGFPDVYIGNDFFENDYLYRNNGDKTFSELSSNDIAVLGHTSHYSMGNTISDINNDGRADIISLDMLPQNIETLKSSGLEDDFVTYAEYLKNGYHPQYMQNTLHLNKGNWIFSEVGFFAGIAATEWSWSVLAADFDLDGWRDLYITNGIIGATNNLDYINYISQDVLQYSKRTSSQALEFAKHIPETRVNNYAFNNLGNGYFADVSNEWFEDHPSFSHGAAFADLDNDGDLDIVVNNVNETAFLFRNLAREENKGHYLKLKLKGPKKNLFGIGASVRMYAGTKALFEECFPVKSYLSSMPNEVVIGVGNLQMIDSVTVVWPGGNSQTLKQIAADQTIMLNFDDAVPSHKPIFDETGFLVNATLPLNFQHREESSLDFHRDVLVPYALSNEGPKAAVIDFNSDGLDDISFTGGKFQESSLFIQHKSGEFESVQIEMFKQHALHEDISQVFFDADVDGDLDLIIVSGGNEFATGDPLRPRFYRNDSGILVYVDSEFRNVAINASVVKAADLDLDGDPDIIIGSNCVPGEFGKIGRNYVFINDGKGHFEDGSEGYGQELTNLGLITDIKVKDLDENGYPDVVVVGHWMPVTICWNDGQRLRATTIPNSEGLWHSLAIEDFDHDGDIDFVGGNWGLNSRLQATESMPVRLYRNDFDGDGKHESLLSYYLNDVETLLNTKDELTKRMPSIKKRFLSYEKFARARINDVLGNSSLKGAEILEVRLLASCYFENVGPGQYRIRKLNGTSQFSSVNSIFVDDFNNDGYSDILLAGNNYEISTQLSRLDASHGVLLLNDRRGFFNEHSSPTFNIKGAARDVQKLNFGGETFYVVSMNNDSPVFLKKVLQ